MNNLFKMTKEGSKSIQSKDVRRIDIQSKTEICLLQATERLFDLQLETRPSRHRFRSIAQAKSDPNPGARSAKLFLCEPLARLTVKPAKDFVDQRSFPAQLSLA